MEGSMGCLRKKMGRAGCFPSPLHETLKTCDSNKLTRQDEAAAGCASGTPHPPEKGEPIRETPYEFKGLVGMACPGARSSAAPTFTRGGQERVPTKQRGADKVRPRSSAAAPAGRC